MDGNKKDSHKKGTNIPKKGLSTISANWILSIPGPNSQEVRRSIEIDEAAYDNPAYEASEAGDLPSFDESIVSYSISPKTDGQSAKDKKKTKSKTSERVAIALAFLLALVILGVVLGLYFGVFYQKDSPVEKPFNPEDIYPTSPPGTCNKQIIEYCATFFSNYSLPNMFNQNGIYEIGMSKFNNLSSLFWKCDPNYHYFLCALYFSPCSESREVGKHFIPPCRNLCESVRGNCEIFLEMFMNYVYPPCSTFPNSTDPNICVGGDLVIAPEDKKVACLRDQIKCKDGKFCINKEWICDGHQDCVDNSDEIECVKCSNNLHRCPSGQCIEPSKVCDGVKDCYLGQDEDHCVRLINGGNGYGQLQAMINFTSNSWENICSDKWDMTATNLICTQLGYKIAGATMQEISNTSQPLVTLNSTVQISMKYLGQNLNLSGSCLSGKGVKITCGKIQCGTRPARYPYPLRIVDGDIVTKPGTWPFVAALYGGDGRYFFCGANLVAEQWAITAAHCVDNTHGKLLKDVYLRVGTLHREGFSPFMQERRVIRAFPHPDHDSQKRNDIALLKLETPVVFTDYVRPSCLPPDRFRAPVADRCFVVGYGKTDQDFSGKAEEIYSRTQRELASNIMDLTECIIHFLQQAPSYPLYVTQTNVCTSPIAGKQFCSGDSGSPLFCQSEEGYWYQEGIVRGGFACGVALHPSIYNVIGAHMKWVEEVMNNN